MAFPAVATKEVQVTELPRQDFEPVEDRLARGRALREELGRASFVGWEPPPDRPDPVEVLQRSNEGRLPELVPIRFGRMAVSPFAFLRGSAAVMAEDLARRPVTGLSVQVCGDCHLMNFGIFATPERNVVFGLNDFDETLPGPWEWDLHRLAASFVVAGRDGGIKEKAARAAAAEAVASYREHLWEHALRSPLEVWYDRITMEQTIEEAETKEGREYRRRLLEKARQRVAENLFPKLVREEAGDFRIVDQPPLIFHPAAADAPAIIHEFIETYRESLPGDRRVLFDRYRFRDLAVKVVGVGSVGTRCFVALFSSAGEHPLLLQVKEANASVLERFTRTEPVPHNGERVVVGQRLMQPASDIFLGWGTGSAGRHFYIRQLRDMKVSVTIGSSATALLAYAGYCGRALARAHANSGDAAMIAGYLGKRTVFDEAVAAFAVGYADQTERDHATLVEAIRDGRVEVIEETV
jgi:uncharacterized protein (DUF2252 family)